MLEFSIAIFVVISLILLETPIGFAFGAGALAYGVATGTDISYHATYGLAQVSAFSLLALPLFVLSGSMMGACSISERLLNFINAFVGRRRGGLGVVTVLSCAIFGAISGSAAAAIVAIGKIMAPRMIRDGYEPGYVTALLAVSSVLALMIPPSIPMVVFAIAIQQSVAECFLSTMLPGIILTITYCLLNLFFLRNNAKIKSDTPIPFDKVCVEISRTGKRAFLPMLMPLLILGGIYSGVFTPTEAGAIAFVYALFVGSLIYRELTVAKVYTTLCESAATTGSVIVILFFLFVMSRGMILSQIPHQIAEVLLSITTNKILLLLIINLLLLLMGMVIDDVSGSILAAIILLPVTQQIGIHPLHFAGIVGTNLGLGNITPPCAPLLYMASGVTKVPLNAYIKDSMKFLLFGHIPLVLLVTFVPQLSLFLPTLYAGY